MPKVTRSYVLHALAPPRAWKVRFDQDVMPRVINTVTAVELGAEQVAAGTRRHPAAALGAALGIGYVLGAVLRRKGRQATIADW